MTHMTTHDKQYKTHWHSFWFGFMSSMAIILFFLLVFTVTDRIIFAQGATQQKKTSIAKTSTTTPEQVSSSSLNDVISTLGVDQEAFQTCMDEKQFAQTVQNNIDSGTKAGVKGTPHSFVLIDDALYEIPGAYSEEGMREFFDDLLAGNPPRATNIRATTDLDPVSDDDWIRGEENARITVIEYSDIDCPYSKQYHIATNNIMTDYATSVRWVFRHMPIDGLHPDARQKAEAAECVGSIGGGVAFWEYIDALFAQE